MSVALLFLLSGVGGCDALIVWKRREGALPRRWSFTLTIELCRWHSRLWCSRFKVKEENPKTPRSVSADRHREHALGELIEMSGGRGRADGDRWLGRWRAPPYPPTEKPMSSGAITTISNTTPAPSARSCPTFA